ncbi:Ig-like domain-containing protein [Tetragenococcus koreensis]|uniref:Ig-like domain-containing protein n=1 Tax=Tetragenococcus koreensis TaxID=290335 RepID=UPI001F3FC098|nr:Ig-like domain-containing protein [Tetragenococcus koreensis]MCF1614782.1 Ig-like domain-containing protein [Tetragenococcus koreensis]MCF1624652.1 Ig-like domain-containing protein [Tetragenococcus koreensis]MCF1633071.1 Ig-like domain-containing protein [Tetragenococcus koreensis]
MADTLKVYKGEEVVGSAVRGEDGKAKVTVGGLEANTDYPVGTYKVSFSNEHGESGKVDVPQFKTKPVAVTGVTLSKESLTLEPGAKGSTQATVQPSNATNKDVKFTSSNEAVATVDGKGEITAKTEGSADITVTTVDGGKTAKLKLTVKKAVVNVTGVTVEPKTATLDIGGTQQLTAKVAPANASDKTVTYTTKSSGIATVSATGLITAKAEGKAQIVATTKDGAKTAVCDVTVNAVEEPEPEPEEPDTEE